jgi:hypothetical protein
MGYQETIAQLLNRCAQKLSAEDYGALQSLLTGYGYDPHAVESEDDDPTTLTPQQSEELLDFLSSRFGVDELQSVVNSLGEITAIPARDEPLPFPGMPKPGGTMSGAQDAARKAWRKLAMDRALHAKPQAADSFAARFPEAMKIQHDVAATIAGNGKTSSQTGAEGFLSRFPDAARIKI